MEPAGLCWVEGMLMLMLDVMVFRPVIGYLLPVH